MRYLLLVCSALVISGACTQFKSVKNPERDIASLEKNTNLKLGAICYSTLDFRGAYSPKSEMRKACQMTADKMNEFYDNSDMAAEAKCVQLDVKDKLETKCFGVHDYAVLTNLRVKRGYDSTDVTAVCDSQIQATTTYDKKDCLNGELPAAREAYECAMAKLREKCDERECYLDNASVEYDHYIWRVDYCVATVKAKRK